MAILEAQGRIDRKVGRKPALLFAVLLVLVTGVLGYLAHYGKCDAHSKFCVVDVAGTRSEVGFAWLDGPDLYVSTQPH